VSHSFPVASALAGYQPEDREWIKLRVEAEQIHRQGLLNQLVQNDHEANVIRAEQTHRYERERQFLAVGLLMIAIVACGVMTYLGFGYYALCLVAILVGTPVATTVGHPLSSISRATRTSRPGLPAIQILPARSFRANGQGSIAMERAK